MKRPASLNQFCAGCRTNAAALRNAGNHANLSLLHAVRIMRPGPLPPNHLIYQEPCTPVMLIQQPQGRPCRKCHQAQRKTCFNFIMQSIDPNIPLNFDIQFTLEMLLWRTQQSSHISVRCGAEARERYYGQHGASTLHLLPSIFVTRKSSS